MIKGKEVGMADSESSFRSGSVRYLVRIFPVFLFLNSNALAQLTTYLGTSGSMPALSGSSVTLQVRANDLGGAAAVTSVSVLLGPSLKTHQIAININAAGNTISMNGVAGTCQPGVNCTSPNLSISPGSTTLSAPFGLPDLQITAYRLALVNNEYQIDLTLQRSSNFAGMKQIVLLARDATHYSKPWTSAAAGTWYLAPTGPMITSFTGTTTMPVNYTPVSNETSPCLKTPTPATAPETIATNAIPIGPYCATATVSGFPTPMTTGNITITVNGRNAPVISVDTTGTQVSFAGAGVASWDGIPMPLVITQTSTGGVSTSTSPFPIMVGTPNPKLSWAAASRFLEQATFGPTHSAVVHLQSIGIDNWFAEQFGMAQSAPFTTAVSDFEGHFFHNAVTAPDQLRKKMAFVLSQLFVVSYIKDGETPIRVVAYHNLLDKDAFTNYNTLLYDVTLSPHMGYYLDMAGNTKVNPSENYAREILQLFSIGPWMLNLGGQQVDSTGAVVTATNGKIAKPAYGHPEISNFARVFTGWMTDSNEPFNDSLDPAKEVMTLNPDQTDTHDTGAKTLLTVPAALLSALGATAPVNSSIAAGGTATSDLNAALANIESHPNVAPFISKFLIQHFVTSNPSAAYVQRVATQFLNSQGDMPTLLKAILKDPEARAGDTYIDCLPIAGLPAPACDSNFGHLLEPAQMFSALCRALNINLIDNANELGDGAPWGASASTGQEIFAPPSVFNYYMPSNTVSPKFTGGQVSLPAGATTPGGALLGPEFQIQSPSAAYTRLQFTISDLTGSPWNEIDAASNILDNIDLGPWSNLAWSNGCPASNQTCNYDLLIDSLDAGMTHGTMPIALHNLLVQTLPAPGTYNPLINYYTSPYANAKLAIYLLSTHSYYQVKH